MLKGNEMTDHTDKTPTPGEPLNGESVRLLRAGDVLQYERKGRFIERVRFTGLSETPSGSPVVQYVGGEDLVWFFTFVSRPDYLAAVEASPEYAYEKRIAELEHQLATLSPSPVEKLVAGDMWWNPSNDEAGFNHWSDAFEDANEDYKDWSVKLDRAQRLPPVWAALVTIDGERKIKLFATEAEADAARQSREGADQ